MNREECLTGLTLYKGNSSEAVVLSAYVHAGFLVSLPFGGGAAYDFIVDTGARLVRVQVKTGKLEESCVVYNSRRHRGSKYDTFSPYREDEVNFFAVWCPENEQLFAVPAEQSLNTEGRLRLAETRNCQAKKIRWAREFAWERHIQELKAERTRRNGLTAEAECYKSSPSRA
ncbi:MAG TPA: group I intron-associated PD-(D/E)XK endonuclease [Pyrinomonadaceae bacterium]|nr:group I intron-associated PD-(D/E)XK endonuclease [Pyrinomonadaceae bacterium]